MLPSYIETKIKRKFLEGYKNNYSLDDIKINYYGCYNGYYAIKCKNKHEMEPQVIVDEYVTIGGIRFKMGYTDIQLWKL